ncbi:diguanylate cyclase domain-containing protein [Bowmanella dokdonensis]|uniref:Diguanylate cyclase n=1 Tax=Bowmanella dokdonensis TaxID=751969 RepID=A0A939DRA4_9ALTE|nr:diguanylate cyclase [Bowmanella dokdonensis]
MKQAFSSLLPEITDQLLDAICVVDAEGHFLYLSAACERIFGYQAHELFGRRMIELVHPDDRARTLQAAREIMQGSPKPHFENRYIRKDGTVVDIMWSARWFDSQGVRVAVARDVSSLKRAERTREVLYQVTQTAYGADNLAVRGEKIHQLLLGLLPLSSLAVVQYDRGTRNLSCPFSIGPEPPELHSGVLQNNSPLSRILLNGQSLNLRAAQLPSSLPEQSGDWLGIPFPEQDWGAGALIVQLAGPGGFTEQDRQLLQFVATQLAMAITRRLTEQRLIHMASHDALTNLPNRNLFHDRLETALKLAQRNRQKLALLYVDLNRFKDINDNLGHETGDLLLLEVAKRLDRIVRDADTVARMGGDEFTLLLTGIRDENDVQRVEEKITEAFRQPFELQEHCLNVSVSIGAAIYPEHGRSPEQLFRVADKKMYALKKRQKADTPATYQSD